MTRLLVAVGLVLSIAAPLVAQTVGISACGQTVPAGATGVVTNDITCPGSDPFIVALDQRATLDLAGFTLDGGVRGVRCTRRCTVTSSSGVGTIGNATAASIAMVDEGSRADLSNLNLVGDGYGVLADPVRSTVRGSLVNVAGSGVGIGIQARTVKLSGLTASGKYIALQAGSSKLIGSTISAIANYAIVGRTARLYDSSVTGSGGGIDLFTQKRPRLVNSTCGVSRDFGNPSQTWGVCTSD